MIVQWAVNQLGTALLAGILVPLILVVIAGITHQTWIALAGYLLGPLASAVVLRAATAPRPVP